MPRDKLFPDVLHGQKQTSKPNETQAPRAENVAWNKLELPHFDEVYFTTFRWNLEPARPHSGAV